MLEYRLDDELPATIPYVKIGDEDRVVIFASTAFLRQCGADGDFTEACAVMNLLLQADDRREAQLRSVG